MQNVVRGVVLRAQPPIRTPYIAGQFPATVSSGLRNSSTSAQDGPHERDAESSAPSLVGKHIAGDKPNKAIHSVSLHVDSNDVSPSPTIASRRTSRPESPARDDTFDTDFRRFDHVRISPEQPTIVSEDGNKTYRLRKYGNKPLPIPEIMDPIYLEARNRYKVPKAYADEENLTPFQQRLSMNPYAYALDQPIRQCGVTKVRLPASFLTPFILHFPTVEEEQEGPQKPSLRPYYKTYEGSPKNYLLGTREAVEHVNHKGKWSVIPGEYMKRQYAHRKQKKVDNVDPKKDFDWDPDMPEIVLKTLRSDLLDELESLMRAEPDLFWRPSDDRVIQAEDVACVIRLSGDNLPTETDLSEKMSENDFGQPQEDHIIFPEVPAYDLRALFPREELDQFCSANGIGDSQIALMKHQSQLAMILWLERLQNYIRGSGE